jgi:hypothetical protein
MMPRPPARPRLRAPTEEEASGMALIRKKKETGEPKVRGAGRSIAIWALIVLASVISVVLILTLWVDRQVLDNKSWENATRNVVTDPKIQSSLSVFLVNQLYDNVDVAAALEERLPSNLDSLAPTLAGALRQPATNAVKGLLSRPRIQNVFIRASDEAHQKLINVLENRTGHGISTGNGVVTIDLKEILLNLAQNLGLSGERIKQLPPDAGVITLMTSDQLGTVQTLVRLVHKLSAWLLILVLALYALAIYLARGTRREALRNVSWSFIIVGLLVLLVRRWVGNSAIDTLASDQYKGSVRDLWLIGSEILGSIGRATVIYGAVGLFGAILAGPTRIATRARRWFAPTLNERPEVVWGAVTGLFLLLLLWGPTHALREWWGILLLAGLLALGLVALRRETLKEFPPDTAERPEAAAAPAPQ